MSTYGVKLPDVGEGVAEAELISWCVQVGDVVTTDSVLAEVMTDKATVEVACPVAGVVVALHGEPGDVLAVGAELVGVELEGDGPAPAHAPGRAPAPAPVAATEAPAPASTPVAPVEPAGPRTARGRAVAAPAVRARAHALGIDLATVAGTGPDGRVLHADLDRLLAGGGVTSRRGPADDRPTIEPVRGLRRRIADRLSAAWTEIPHITYVEAVDVTDLEALRAELNRRNASADARLTILPFLVRAIVIACGEQPRLNATYDAVAQELSISAAVHVGIATQTPDGLMVPVLRHAEALDTWAIAAEVTRLAAAAREGSATRTELSGSTITITSLGALGGLVTTPIINQPEVAIIGVNKLETRPVWRHGTFEPRQMMNLSSSFDHRIVDGWDAAVFVQRIRSLLEMPALLFVDDPA
jgi:2-oxoisovalerate dehydrogenase E2 component (dihydrolipoyl transacylase)